MLYIYNSIDKYLNNIIDKYIYIKVKIYNSCYKRNIYSSWNNLFVLWPKVEAQKFVLSDILSIAIVFGYP